MKSEYTFAALAKQDVAPGPQMTEAQPETARPAAKTKTADARARFTGILIR